jgi:sigma-E factor negative regulatory protein RseB
LDSWRYGRQLWVDAQTGLLLKANLLNEKGEPLESLAFTELHIGAPVTMDAVKPSYADAANTSGAWQVRQTRTRDLKDDSRWLFKTDLPGFRRQAAMARNISSDPGKSANEVMHWVYSDGLAAISVFIQPLRSSAGSGETGPKGKGAFSIFKRVVDGNQILVMGDVPPATVQRFAEGIEVRSK